MESKKHAKWNLSLSRPPHVMNFIRCNHTCFFRRNTRKTNNLLFWAYTSIKTLRVCFFINWKRGFFISITRAIRYALMYERVFAFNGSKNQINLVPFMELLAVINKTQIVTFFLDFSALCTFFILLNQMFYTPRGNMAVPLLLIVSFDWLFYPSAILRYTSTTYVSAFIPMK